MSDSSKPADEFRQRMTRRALLGRGGFSLGSVALATLLAEQEGSAKTRPLPANGQAGHNSARPHLPARAKNVIFLHMVGAPSTLDLFEHKPVLQQHSGELMPDELWKGLRLAFIRKQPRLFGSPFQTRQHGQSGMYVSELLPHFASVVDDVTLIRSVHTEQFNHAPAQLLFQTGFARFGRPCVGSWVSYGLGTENRNLPAFVVLITGSVAGAGNSLWGSGFLPSVHQGIEFRSSGDPVLFLSNPAGIDTADRRRTVDSINFLNRQQLADVGDPEIAARIAQYEKAYRMQTAVPELMDTASEPKHIHELYGTQPGQASFANNCLLARRLVERGVRFVQLFDSGWDHHSNVAGNLRKKCGEVDRPMSALVTDLKQRGLLDDTLVVWGGEFGRTPMLQGTANDGQPNAKAGRDHHKDAFCIWMAGGGVQPGFTYGQTDDLGFHVVEDPMHINDFHATLLHLLGLDHKQLTFRFQGRPFRLTDIAGEVATKILA